MKILLVEDDENILEVLTIYLESEGHFTVQANTSKKASAIIKSISFDLAVVDMLMGNEDTSLLIQELKYLDVKILVMSAGNLGPLFAKRHNCPFLGKPFELENLETLLTQNLN